MFRNKSASTHQFAMVPSSNVPRSSFRMQSARKSTFNSGFLVPMVCEEVLPGDKFNLRATFFARLATPIFPFMDNMYLESFFFFVPNRLVWGNWVKLMGEQLNPGDSISFSVPQCVSPVGGYTVGSLQDYFGLPTVGQVGGAATISHNNLPLRGYNLIYDQWFRDENLQVSVSSALPIGDGPDNPAGYVLLRRGKRHDYFTSCLPFLQKGTQVTIPLAGNAIVIPNPAINPPVPRFRSTPDTAFRTLRGTAGTPNIAWSGNVQTTGDMQWENTSPTAATNTALVADLTTVSAISVNALRLSLAIQKLLERDARGGTRYTEILESQFDVKSPDARLQRTEYLGGGSSPVSINPIAQTSGTGTTGTTAPLANLAAVGSVVASNHGFTQSFVEHGYVIGLINVRADLTYQQGLRKHWSRLTRYDFYTPAFAELGEQAVLNKEIYVVGTPAQDDAVFGYQERWAELRYGVSQITGLMRSTSAGTLDAWHLSQKFLALPTLNSTFISDFPPVARVVATPSLPEFLLDAFIDIVAARPLPTYSVPGLGDRF